MANQIIIGNGISGTTAALTLLKKNPDLNVIMISEEPFHSYARMLLPDYIAGLIPEEKLFPYQADRFASLRLVLGKKVEEIRFQENAIVIEGGEKLSYQNLLIASGASPRQPPIEGLGIEGVSTLRNLNEARKIITQAGCGNRAVVLGGGLVGLEATGALVQRGFKVTIIIKSPQILSRVLDENGARIVEAYLKRKGVDIYKNTDVVAIDLVRRKKSVLFDSGEQMNCDLVVVAKGVKPNVDFIAGDDLDIDNGIIVNQKMETNIPGIYAAGDVAMAPGFLEKIPIHNATWAAAVYQGMVAASSMAGAKREYEGNLKANIFEFLGLKAASIGQGGKPAGDCDIFCLEESGCYKKLVFHQGKLVGALLIGAIAEAGILQHLIKKKIDLRGAEELCLRNRVNSINVMQLFKSV